MARLCQARRVDLDGASAATTVLDLPVRGRWLVQNSPADRVPSHGTEALGSSHAIDLVPVDARGRSGPWSWRTALATERPEVFHGFGAAVMAPVDGTVVDVHDGEPDHEARRSQLLLVGYLLTQGRRVRAGAAGIAGNVSYAAHLRRMGEAHELYDARQMKEITGSDHYQGGLYTPGTAMIQPAGYVQGLAAGLERAGVRIYENAPVLRLESGAQGWRVATAQGEILAQRLILANNGSKRKPGVGGGVGHRQSWPSSLRTFWVRSHVSRNISSSVASLMP